MAQARKSNVTPTNRINRATQRTQAEYIYGNAVRKLDVRRQLEEEPRRQLSHETRKNRDKAHHMSLGYVLFLVTALCAAGLILINYIQLQAQLTNKMEQIARVESQLNTLRVANDEEYNRIVNSLDLEEIKRIAIGELGIQKGLDVFPAFEITV